MTDISILLADNDSDYLATCGEFLESAGYHILKADRPSEAKEILESSRVHLAILDLRMENDSDEKDRSGLQLAKTTARSVPKLILTRFPTYQDVVEALKSDLHDLPPAVDFLDKRKDLSQLLASVRKVLAEHLRINWELIIHWESVLSFAQLVYLIEPELDRGHLVDRTAELEDLFRKLFRKYTHVTIGRLLTRGPEYAILSSYAYDADGLEIQALVCCGQHKLIEEERRKYQTAVSQRIGSANMAPDNAEETTRFAASVYRLAAHQLEESINLGEFFRRHPDKTPDSIERLYKANLNGWYEKGRFTNQEETVYDFYKNWLKQNTPALTERQLQQCVQALCAKLLGAGLGQVDYSAHALTLHLPAGNGAINFPNPIACLNDKRSVDHTYEQWGMTHGRINLETVLLDQDGPWLIDFTQAGKAPLLHDFVSLETAVKLHLPSAPYLHDRYAIERRLSALTNLNDNLESDNQPEVTVQIVNAVIRIRQLAAELTGCELEAYLTALFFHAVNYLTTYKPDIYYTRQALAPYAHALITAATICQQLGRTPSKQDDLPDEANQGLWIDKANKAVWVEGAPIDLTLQDYQILIYLYDHAGQLCERKNIITQGLGEEYNEYYQEESRLNSAMSRLRQKIEPNPRKPRYLITVRGRGYKLTL